jgi:mRNA-degrading endonuclease YafQ of YafQ-DinJ toxin-antitoxin module
VKFQLAFTRRAHAGRAKIQKSGNQGKIKQMKKALNLLENEGPAYPSLQSHQATGKPFGRANCWISYIRTGPGGERIVWAYGDRTGEIQVLDIEYIGAHVDP